MRVTALEQAEDLLKILSDLMQSMPERKFNVLLLLIKTIYRKRKTHERMLLPRINYIPKR